MTSYSIRIFRYNLTLNPRQLYYTTLHSIIDDDTHHSRVLLSGEPDYFGRKKISSGGDLSHYSSASLY